MAAEWKFSQVFGERAPGDPVEDVDIISAIEFDRRGEYLATGDHGGRVVLFKKINDDDRSLKGDLTYSVDSRNMYQQTSRKVLEGMDHPATANPKYVYKTEFQSHEPEFDYLKSLEVQEKINKLRWCAAPNNSQFILSTNDRTIKLWKAFNIGEGFSSRCQRVYSHAHDYNINSISNNSDGETFVSADDLRINLWNVEISNQCFNIVDMKPSDMEDLVEVITSAEFHPTYCNLLAYSSSRGFIRLVDMRRSALCDKNARILQHCEAHGSRSFFTEIVASISDIKFAKDGRHILSRDYMNLKLWDLHMETSPVATFKIHEYLRPKLSDLYNSDSIFDKFDCCLSQDGSQFASGSYSNTFKIFSRDGPDEGIALEASRHPNRISHSHNGPKTTRLFTRFARGHNQRGHEHESPNTDTSNGVPCDVTSKLIHLAWHPTDNLIACAAANSLYMYHA
ncbi:serine/threonine protein phosphatase 2A 55 kDa regulatory subunit B alpha isoform-like isoform X4 [Asparagus officinalis]|uniref:serine/threonine protein phosphatase 2A 55 kDa regulatory subunit B alpha isoform-like isoform X4 n=1 Tax=Asparagus officinalis TaxID=4686 RepID=UPI00098E3064|nr:serine/threonine protein phosphatase 2A 55 kDa regulatory subunit B alpha isoform-like isoform X4 [Asparagus officinalis]